MSGPNISTMIAEVNNVLQTHLRKMVSDLNKDKQHEEQTLKILGELPLVKAMKARLHETTCRLEVTTNELASVRNTIATVSRKNASLINEVVTLRSQLREYQQNRVNLEITEIRDDTKSNAADYAGILGLLDGTFPADSGNEDGSLDVGEGSAEESDEDSDGTGHEAGDEAGDDVGDEGGSERSLGDSGNAVETSSGSTGSGDELGDEEAVTGGSAAPSEGHETEQTKSSGEEGSRSGESEDVEVEELEIAGKTYYTDDRTNGTVYEHLADGEIGDIIGHLENGQVFFS